MGTQFFDCGCFIVTSVFGDRPILSVNPCTLHLEMPEIQHLLVALAQKLRETLSDA